MGIGQRRTLTRALVFALVTTLLFTVLPLLRGTAASFLGKDVSELAAGVISFYPWSAVAEVARVLGAAFLVAFCAGVLAARAMLRCQSRWSRLAVFPGAPLVGYALWGIGAVIKYPALYEGALPGLWQTGIWHLAGVIKPSWLFSAAWVAAVVPLIMMLLPSRKRPLMTREKPAWIVPAALVAAAVAQDVQNPVVHAGTDRPNVLFIGIDSLRFDRLARPEVLPTLSSLLKDPELVSFQSHWVGVPRTFPSWVEMIQGQYAPKTGIRHMFPSFGARRRPFAGFVSALREAGYETNAVSDFAGDIFPRFEAGFSQVVAPKLTLKTMIRLSVDQSLAMFLPLMTTGPLRGLFPALKESPAFGDPSHLGAAACSYMTTGAKPWLTTLFFSTAHFPYAAPYPYYRMFADPNYSGKFLFQKNPEMGVESSSETEILQARALYDGALRSIDDEIQKIFRGLKEQGLWDQTLIVVTADHGEDLFENGTLQGHGEHLRGENVLKVPFLLKLPATKEPKRTRIEFTTRSIDVAATILDGVGLAPETLKSDGISMVPWIMDEHLPSPEFSAYAETEIWFGRSGNGFFQSKRLDYPGIAGLLNFDQGYSGEITLDPNYEKIIITAKHRMLLDSTYKLIYMPTSEGVQYELYDQKHDPKNLVDLSARDPERVRFMSQKLLAFAAAQEGAKVDVIGGYLVAR